MVGGYSPWEEPAAVSDVKLLVIVLQALFSLYLRQWQSSCLFLLSLLSAGESRKYDPNFKGPINNRWDGFVLKTDVRSLLFVVQQCDSNILPVFSSGAALMSSAVSSSSLLCWDTLPWVFWVRAVLPCYKVSRVIALTHQNYTLFLTVCQSRKIKKINTCHATLFLPKIVDLSNLSSLIGAIIYLFRNPYFSSQWSNFALLIS